MGQYSVLLQLITMGSGRLDSGFCCLKVALDTSSQIIAIFSLIIGLVGCILGIVDGYWASMISGILSILAGGFLFYGAYKKRYNFALFYLVVTFIRILLYIILVIAYFINYADTNISGYLTYGIIYILIAGLMIYFWVVVFSFYKHLKANTITTTVVHTLKV